MYYLVSKAETILAKNEVNNAKALINNPKRSSAFCFIKTIEKYMKIITLINCEIIVNILPILILRNQSSYNTIS